MTLCWNGGQWHTVMPRLITRDENQDSKVLPRIHQASREGRAKRLSTRCADAYNGIASTVHSNHHTNRVTW